jgi:hypothetical protein
MNVKYHVKHYLGCLFTWCTDVTAIKSMLWTVGEIPSGLAGSGRMPIGVPDVSTPLPQNTYSGGLNRERDKARISPNLESLARLSSDSA